MGRSPCCVKEGLNKGAWTEMEDKMLTEYIKVHGEGRWRNLPKKAGLKRCGKSCRLRWLNYLRPDIKRGNITPDEEELIIRLHKLLGNRWSLIAGRLPGRTDNEIKNYWNTTLGKRVNQHSRNNNSTTCKHLKKPPNIQKGKRVLSSNQSMTHSPQTEFSVVRTKAVHCTKVIVNQLQPQPQPRQCTQLSDGIILQPSSMDNNIKDSLINHDPSTMVVEEETIMPKDLKVDDFNMGDFNLIAELLNSEFTEICDFSNESSSNNANDLSTNSLHQPFVFSQDMLEDWLSLEIN